MDHQKNKKKKQIYALVADWF